MREILWNSRGGRGGFWALVLFGSLLFQAACGGGGGGSGATQVSLSPSQVNLTPEEVVPLSTEGLDTAALSWQSSDAHVATVDQAGLVTGVAVGVATITASSDGVQVSATVGVVSPNPGAANVSLSGIAQYEDRPFDQNGFVATLPLPRLPMRHVVINVIAIDGFTQIASSTTDTNGAFLFTNMDNSTRRGGLYLQALSKTGPASHPTQVQVQNNNLEASLFGLASSAVDDTISPSAVRNFTADAAGIGGVFNLIDVFSKGSELVQQSDGCNVTCVPPLLTAYWEPGGGTGTFYDDVLDTIFICGGGDLTCSDGDTDEYDDAVVAHEYGHFLLNHFSHDDSPGGVHFLSDNGQDIRLSWSEGWGNFFSSAMRGSPLYVDTDAEGFFSLELEGVTSSDVPTLPTLAVYVTNETAVAATLWDFLDDPTSDDDPVQRTFTEIWQAVMQIGPQTPATFESFWVPLSTSADVGTLQPVLSGRKIELVQDTYETTGETLLHAGETQHHTLYRATSVPSEDEDVIPFEVISGTVYLLETRGLTNGADTLLSVTNTAGTLIPGLQNDNHNGKLYTTCQTFCPPNDDTTLASALSFEWSEPSTTLYAHVKRSSVAPPSAGLNGAYDLRLLSLF